MESTLVTSPLRFAAFKTTAHIPYHFHSPRPSQFRLKTTCGAGFYRFGSSSFGAGHSRPVRKSLQSGDGATECDKETPSEDVILLNVGGMMCGGCVDSVTRILQSQPQVSSASVKLETETATIWPVAEVKAIPNWQQQVGEALAKHLTTCGFESSARGGGATEGGLP